MNKKNHKKQFSRLVECTPCFKELENNRRITLINPKLETKSQKSISAI